MSTARTILVVEDDPVIARMLDDRLVAEGYRVVRAVDGPGAVEADARHDPDLVLLDLMLPGFDGVEVCRRVQQRRPVPVIMLTARDEESDVLVGLGVGADDYVTKPFRMRELLGRVQAVLRRVELSARGGDAVVLSGPVRLDPASRRVDVDGTDVALTPTEFDLLRRLMASPGEVLGRDRLLADVWGWDAEGTATRTVDSHVKSLRAKVGAGLVRTVHGVGYAFEPGGRA